MLGVAKDALRLARKVMIDCRAADNETSESLSFQDPDHGAGVNQRIENTEDSLEDERLADFSS